MNSVIELMEKDHLAIEGGFREIARVEEPMEKAVVFSELASVLEFHTRAEESMVYPALLANPLLGKVVSDAKEELQTIREIVRRVQCGDPSKAAWSENVTRLERAVRRHVAEEEGVVFAQMRDLFTVTQLKEMAVDYRALKENWAAAV